MKRLTLIAASALLLPLPANAGSDDIAVVGATLIDVGHYGSSERDQADSVVVIRHGVISAVGDRATTTVPAGIRVIDGSGKYLVPGLIDGFGSLRTQGYADAYLYAGVTTVFVNRAPAGADGEQGVLATLEGPRVLLGAVVGGFRDTDGERKRLTPAELAAGIDRLADTGVRELVIGLDVSPEQLDSILSRARQRQLATSGEFAATPYAYAIRSGVGSLLRVDRYLTSLSSASTWSAYAVDPTGRSAGPAFRAVCTTDLSAPEITQLGLSLAAAKTVLMPILSIEATADDVGAPNPWWSESAAFVRPDELDDPVDPASGDRAYLLAHPDRKDALQACARHRQEVGRRLHALGARYLAGSGAPAFGIMPGGGLHQELRLLQETGLTPREALAAATSNFADAYGWRDVGRIEAGRVGDLLLVRADPRKDAAALDAIEMVVHDGQVVDRAALLSRSSGLGRRPAANDAHVGKGAETAPAEPGVAGASGPAGAR
jgi:hypothetical protein